MDVQVKPVDTSIEAGAQVQQLINVECVEDFKDRPALIVQFLLSGQEQRISLELPLSINKFFQPTVMNSESFFARWKNLNK